MELFELRGRVALVTGASKGLGKSMAMALGEAGADIVMVARGPVKLAEAEKEVADMGVRTLTVAADVTIPEDVDKMVSQALAKFGKIDILVNNVGTYVGKPIEESTTEDWFNLINTNLTSTYLCCRAVGKHMMERQRGKVVNMAAAIGALGARNSSAYCASKGGVIQLTRALAVEWAKYHITVNAIAPGTMETEITAKMLEDPKVRKALEGKIPMNRIGQPSDLAGTVIFLSASGSDYITGQTIFVDGGFSVQ
ncbi:MAG TPA: SDR family NAD(P)-dependent oxidoreductase [Candidatus Avalokitesvara rifleensis]|uniref:SDR family NAD(P)-dependent oxidoreductase n=1 Tax=Candidatus Avalokitesvara rifleensis TaxID=3367620 RepID=UPI00271379F2|nr:glucose 1-dehydrogenase [Candidatus Brocadiales bacterium]